MDFNWLEALIVGLSVYGALRGEIAYRRWSARRNWKPNPPHTRSKIKEKGVTENAAEAIRCGNCGLNTKTFQAYDDGDKWCLPCDATEEG